MSEAPKTAADAPEIARLALDGEYERTARSQSEHETMRLRALKAIAALPPSPDAARLAEFERLAGAAAAKIIKYREATIVHQPSDLEYRLAALHRGA